VVVGTIREGCCPNPRSPTSSRLRRLAALVRLRVAFGPIEVVEVISHDPAAIQVDRLDDPAGEGDEPGADDE
jgi:hypothetical protein